MALYHTTLDSIQTTLVDQHNKNRSRQFRTIEIKLVKELI